MATLKEAAVTNHKYFDDCMPSNIEHGRSGASITSFEDDHLMAGDTHQPSFEPLMSGALQDIEMEENVQSDVISSFSSYHIPGTYPDSPAPPQLPSGESLMPDAKANDASDVSHEQNSDELARSDEQAADEMGTPRSEASDEPDIPDVQPTINFPLQTVDSRPRNYKGDLLDDWQIKVCRQFEAIHPPPRQIPRQATSVPKQPLDPNSIGLIESRRSPLANGPSIMPDQQLGTTATGLIDSPRSPMANVYLTRADGRAVDPHGSSPGVLTQPHSLTSIGSNDLHRSPLDLHKATTELLYQPRRTTSIGSNDLQRSPLDLHGVTTDVLHQTRGTTSIGSSDLYRSPLADVSPTRAGDVLNHLHDAATNISHQPLATAAVGSIDAPRSPLANVSSVHSPHGTKSIGSIDSPRSPLANTSSVHSPHGTNSIGSIDSPRSPLVDVSPIHSPHGTNPIGSIDSPRSPLVDVSPIHLPLGTSLIGSFGSPRSILPESHTEVAVDAMTDTYEAGANVLDHTLGATPVPSKSSLTRPSAAMTTTPAASPSKWSIRSLYAHVRGKSKKRSPLGERVDNANIHKVPKTPKKVSWPENGPVTGTKRFVKHETMSHPSPSSSREDSSILSSVPSDLSPQHSPTMQEEEEEVALNPKYQIHPLTSADNDWSMSPISSNKIETSNPRSKIEHTDAIHSSGEEQTTSSSSSSDNEGSVQSVKTPTKTTVTDPSTPPSYLSPKLEELTISTRRSSLRRREKEDQAQKLRDAIAAKEKARKEKEEAEEKARKDKEEAEERARIKAEEEEERKKTGGRRIPIERVIQSLPPGWDEKVRINMAKGMREQLALTSVGNPLTRRDFGMVLPQPGTGDDTIGWLNDEVISGYLQAVVDYGHRAMGHPRGAKPRMHAFSPFFYTTLKERGYDAVKRWSARGKIGGNDLKTVEYVFIPCNPTRSHWTLIVVSPIRKTIEVFDSMHGSSLDKVDTTKKWLKGELGRSYIDSEWTVIEDPVYRDKGKGPTQNNHSDCGVFAVTTAKMLVLGVDPMAVSAEDMPLQRRRVVAELLNGGFSGDFEPRVVFE